MRFMRRYNALCPAIACHFLEHFSPALVISSVYLSHSSRLTSTHVVANQVPSQANNPGARCFQDLTFTLALVLRDNPVNYHMLAQLHVESLYIVTRQPRGPFIHWHDNANPLLRCVWTTASTLFQTFIKLKLIRVQFCSFSGQ
jgi:hypothetical protein